MSEPKIEPLTKLGNYLLEHQNVIDACWTAKVIEEARQQHTVHLEHVQQFLNEMYATMIDPCEQPEMKISEMCTLLLKTATEQRQQINDLSEHAPSSPAAPTPLLEATCPTCGSAIRCEHGLLFTETCVKCEEPEVAAPEVTPSPCCENPNLEAQGPCEHTSRLHPFTNDSFIGTCASWIHTHNVCLNCGQEEAL